MKNQANHKSKPGHSAYTLTELLIVMAIIALVTAISIPVFLRVRESGRRSTCQSNLRQIGMGLMQYTQDNDEKFMQQWNGHNTYKEIIQPYLKSRSVWVCPSNPQNDDISMYKGPEHDVGTPAIPVSYAANVRVIMRNSPGAVMSLTFIKEPTQKIALCDSNYWWSAVDPGQYNGPDAADLPDGGGYLLYAGHLDTINCLFLDGHVKAMKPTAMATPINMWGTMGDNTRDGDCDPGSYLTQDLGINCDQVSPGQLRYFKNVEEFYR